MYNSAFLEGNLSASRRVFRLAVEMPQQKWLNNIKKRFRGLRERGMASFKNTQLCPGDA